MKTYGVILAGGGGTRFWPLSRKELPKQLLNLTGKDLMVNETIDRLEGNVTKENIFVVTNSTQAELMLHATGSSGPCPCGAGGEKYGGLHRLCGDGDFAKIRRRGDVHPAFRPLY